MNAINRKHFACFFSQSLILKKVNKVICNTGKFKLFDEFSQWAENWINDPTFSSAGKSEKRRQFSKIEINQVLHFKH